MAKGASSRAATTVVDWLVEGGRHQRLGEVQANDHSAAVVEARKRWPREPTIRVASKRAVEAARRKLQAKIDRDPGPYAYHEAAHAVVGESAFGEETHRVKRVTIDAFIYLDGDYDSLGCVEWEPDPPYSRIFCDNEKRHIAEAKIIETLAGPIAEWLYRPRRRSPRLGDSDLECVNHYAGHHSRCQMLSAFRTDNPVQERFIDWLESRARYAVASHWKCIEHVAEALIHRRELSGEEVRNLIKEVEPRPDDKDRFRERLETLFGGARRRVPESAARDRVAGVATGQGHGRGQGGRTARQ